MINGRMNHIGFVCYWTVLLFLTQIGVKDIPLNYQFCFFLMSVFRYESPFILFYDPSDVSLSQLYESIMQSLYSNLGLDIFLGLYLSKILYA